MDDLFNLEDFEENNEQDKNIKTIQPSTEGKINIQEA